MATSDVLLDILMKDYKNPEDLIGENREKPQGISRQRQCPPSNYSTVMARRLGAEYSAVFISKMS